MSIDYTPSLKRTEACVVTKVRRLRPPCRIEVKTGQKVEAGSVIAILEEPGQGHMILLGETELAIPMDILLTYMGFDYTSCVVKKTGDYVAKGEILAKRKPIGFRERTYHSPFDGLIYLLREPGVVGIRETKEVKVTAFIPGQASRIIPDREIAIETPAALVQGTYGIGGETFGELRVMVETSASVAQLDELGAQDKGKILVCGSSLETGFLSRAKEIGVKGIVVASLHDDELGLFLGYDPGMITGHERAGLSLVMTQGFGDMPMLDSTFDILRKFEGKTAYLNGSTQMRAGVIRPEVIIPRSDLSLEECRRMNNNRRALGKGSRVRVLGGRHFGEIGVVRDDSPRLNILETGSESQVLEVQLEGSGLAIVPRSNVELVE